MWKYRDYNKVIAGRSIYTPCFEIKKLLMNSYFTLKMLRASIFCEQAFTDFI